MTEPTPEFRSRQTLRALADAWDRFAATACIYPNLPENTNDWPGVKLEAAVLAAGCDDLEVLCPQRVRDGMKLVQRREAEIINEIHRLDEEVHTGKPIKTKEYAADDLFLQMRGDVHKRYDAMQAEGKKLAAWYHGLADELEATGKSNTGTQRIWSSQICPACGQEGTACGPKGLEYLSATAFAKRAKMKPATIIKYVRDGTFWSNGARGVPWCKHCGKHTPSGSGQFRQNTIDAAPNTPPYKVNKDEQEQAFSVCSLLVPEVTERSLVAPDAHWDPIEASEPEQKAHDLAQEGMVAILAEVTKQQGWPNPQRLRAVALKQMKTHWRAATKSRNETETVYEKFASESHKTPDRDGDTEEKTGIDALWPGKDTRPRF